LTIRQCPFGGAGPTTLEAKKYRRVLQKNAEVRFALIRQVVNDVLNNVPPSVPRRLLA
jgi:hypothetical protein